MPDMTMCPGKGCPIRNECYRHRAIPDEKWQSWWATPLYNPEDRYCTCHMPLQPGDRLREPSDG